MNIKLPLLLGALVTAALPAAADDFGIWSEATLQKSLGKKFSIDGGIEFRAEDKVSQPVRWAASIGAGYKPCKYISFGIGYVFIHDYNFTETETDYKKKPDAQGNPIFNGYNVDHAFWRNKHRATFDITGKAEAGRFTFSVRERYQYTHYNKAYTLRDKYRDPLPGNMNPDNWTGDLYTFNGQHFTDFSCDENDKKAKDKHYLRSRFQVEYNINHCPLSPYVSYEFSNNLADGMDLEKTRLQVGTEWKVTKKHRLDVAYIFENGSDGEHNDNLHVISVGYKFKF